MTHTKEQKRKNQIWLDRFYKPYLERALDSSKGVITNDNIITERNFYLFGSSTYPLTEINI